MQVLIARFAPLGVFALAIFSNFLFIAFCPREKASTFLFVYAAAGLVASFLGTTFYAGLRNRRADIAFIIVSIALLLNHTLRGGPDAILYGLAAGLLIITDFSVAQTGRAWIINVSRLGSATSSLLLLVDFELALLVRTCWQALILALTAGIKDYNRIEDGRSNLWDRWRILYSLMTCILYFGGLAAIPFLHAEQVRPAYIIYAILGNVILKLQDYSIKIFMAEGSFDGPISSRLLYVLAIFAILAMASVFSPRYLALLPTALGLVYCEKIMKNARWH